MTKKNLDIRKKDALNYHEFEQPGKIEVVPTKKVSSQLDLALAYSPGVAEPCKEIAKNPEDVYRYTAKGNLVGVISNGTAVLGLGNIGPEASKPVMEGKGVLFKKFAGIDVFDIEIDSTDPDEFIRIVKSLEPTFGGINLEDIKAPESFQIESELREKMNIPVMHDDQHGTAIISAAGLINALELINKDISKIKLVVNGAGAAAISCTRLYKSLGLSPQNIIMCDSKGVIGKDRDNLDPSKAEFATDLNISTLEEALEGADVFIGLSIGNIIDEKAILSMADDPIVFALSNPDPEISYALATKTRKDIIMATGRSDHPNQVNNVLGFPYIFRGALDVRATKINEEMKLAAVYALANLTKEPVPELVSRAYRDKKMAFGKNYIIPKPLDPRLITTISPAVAKAAMDSGVAKKHITDWEAYDLELQTRLGIDQKLISGLITRAKNEPRRVVYGEADNYKTLKAAEVVRNEGIGFPILLGNKENIQKIADEYKLDLEGCEIIDPRFEPEKGQEYGRILYEKRKRKGLTLYECNKRMRDRSYYGAMMVETGEADAFISGMTKEYSKELVPALEIIGVDEGFKKVAGLTILTTKKGIFFFADTTVQAHPTAEELLEIIELTAGAVKFFDAEPRIAMLSYSNFGSAKGTTPEKAKKAVDLAKAKFPDLIIDGDIQADIAVNKAIQREAYPFSELAAKGANTFIFPNLAAGNIAYKMMMELGGAEAVGPILLGMKKPVHILQLGSSVSEIVNMTAIAVTHAQIIKEN